jgi:hypothetical protein
VILCVCVCMPFCLCFTGPRGSWIMLGRFLFSLTLLLLFGIEMRLNECMINACSRLCKFA